MEPFFIDGKKFISSKEASNITGYAQDYISRLCRGKKIRGRLVGKNWFINLESLVEFNADQMVAAQKRRLELVSSSKGVRATAPKHSQSTSLFKEMAERALVAATPSRATASIAEATQKSIHAVTHAATSSLALRLQAAAMASFFAFGTIFLFAPSYAAFAVNSTRDEGQQIASSLLHTDASALASQTSDAFVAAAADSENQLLQTVASIEQRAQKFAASLARTLHSAWSNHALLALRPTTQEAAAPAAMGSSAAPPPVSNSHTTTTAGSSTPSPIVNNYYTTNKNFTGGAPTPPVSQGTNTVLIRGGVSESELTSKLQALSDLFNAQINSSVLPSISTLSRQISLSQKVDQITGATFNNVTVSGVSGLAAADIPDLSYLPLAGGTLTGALTLSSALGSGSGGLGTSTWQTGSLPYFNGTRFTEDNANFFWDGTNHRLGLGTTTPAALLSLQQITNGTPILSAYRVTDTAPSGDFIDYYSKAGTTLFRVDNSGNLLAGGIINSGSQTITSASQPQLRLQSDASNEITTSVSSQGTTTIAINGTFPALLFTPQSNAVNQFSFTDAASNSILSIDTANKRIGIGTTTPFAKFAVSLNSGENYPNDNAFVISSSTASATTTLFVVQNSGNVAIGTTTADAKLTISGNTSALPALPTVGTNIHLVGANSGQVNITMDGFAAAPQIITRRAQGTAASPSAVNFAGFNLFNYEISGYGTTGYSTPQNIINVLTDEGWTDSAQGNRITIATTKNGTTGAIERLRITNAGLIGIGNTSPANQLDIGVGTDATAKTGAFSTLNIANTATSSTASVNKTGLQISSTGSWTGTGASNIGLLVSSVTGGTNNYDAIFNGGGAIGIGTTTPYGKFAISLNSGQTYTGNNVFIIASSTSAATTTLFKVDNAGNVAANTRFAFNADGSSTLGQASIDTSGNISLASNNTKLSSAGTLLLQTNNTGVSSAAFIAGSGMLFGFASGAGAFNATLDTGISRISAGVIGFGTGAAASTAGTIVASSAGLGTTTPYGKFALSLNSGETYTGNNAFIIASSTAAATTTLLSVSNTGGITGNDNGTANAIGFRNGTNAQSLNIYNTYTDASNNEKLTLGWSSNTAQVLAGEAGSGGAHSLAFGVDNILYWRISANGHFLAQNDNTNDIGASGANRPRNLYLAGLVNIGGAGSNYLAGNLGIGTTTPYGKFGISLNNGETYTGNNAFIIASSTASATTTLLTVLNSGSVGIGTSSPYKMLSVAGDIIGTNVTATGTVTVAGTIAGSASSAPSLDFGVDMSNVLMVSAGTGGRVAGFGNMGAGHMAMRLSTNAFLEWSSPSDPRQGVDTAFQRVAADKLYLGNGTSNDFSGSLMLNGLGIGTTTPYGKFGISLNNGETYTGNNAFIIASSTAAATTTLFSIDNNGALTAAAGNFSVSKLGVTAFDGGSSSDSTNIFTWTDPNKSSNASYLKRGTGTWSVFGNTGSDAFWFTGDGRINGTVHLKGLAVPSSAILGWGSGTSFSETVDTNMSRLAAGVVAFGTGAQGSAAGTIVASSAGLGTTTPFGKFGISLNNGETYTGNNAFIIASSTSGATTTLFSVSNSGAVVITSTGSLGSAANDPLTIGNNSAVNGNLISGLSGATLATQAFIIDNFGSYVTSGGGARFGSTGGTTGIDVGYNHNGITLGSTAPLLWSAGAQSATGDTGFTRLSAGVLALGTGSVGSTAGTLILNAVGIGTSTPQALLSIGGGNTYSSSPFLFSIASSTALATTTYLTVSNQGLFSFGADTGTPSGIFTIDASSSTTTISNLSIGNLMFDTDAGVVNLSDMPVDSNAAVGTQQAQIINVGGFPLITASGVSNGSGGLTNLNVGIGTSTTPYSTLEVWGSDAASSTPLFTAVNNASTTIFAVFDGGNAQLSGTLSQSSDQRLKTNVSSLDASSSLSNLLQLDPVSFNWIDPERDNATQLGFIAQEMQHVFPTLVSTTSATALTPDGTLAVNYIGLIAPIISAIHELTARIVALEQAVAHLATLLTTQEVDTQKLCVGNTCVTQAQFLAMVAASGQQPQGDPGSGGGSGDASSTPPSAPVISVNGNNPATVNMGDTYTDLGAQITGPAQDMNLGIEASVDGGATTTIDQIQIDTSAPGTHTVLYSATDQNGLVGTASRTVNVVDGSSGN